MAGERGDLRREVGRLVGLVLLVHGLFIAGYFVAGLATAPGDQRFGYLIAWTAATLVVVLWRLARVRAARAKLLRGK
ncbi:MAG: hypothetical protein ABJC36_05170 [Gemmatimonadales bacterium]